MSTKPELRILTSASYSESCGNPVCPTHGFAVRAAAAARAAADDAADLRRYRAPNPYTIALARLRAAEIRNAANTATTRTAAPATPNDGTAPDPYRAALERLRAAM